MAPGFYIEHADWTKILHYARARQSQNVKTGSVTTALNHEIGGMLIAKLDKDGDWVLQDPVILKQETSGGNCTLDKTALADYYIEMIQKYGRDIQFVWWHSHAKMAAFWSGTDTATMKEYAAGQWSMFLVVNVNAEYKFRVQMWDPIEAGEDIELGFINEPDESIPKDILEEVALKCSEETRTTYKQSWSTRYNHKDYVAGSQLALGTDSSYGGYDSFDSEVKDYNKGFNLTHTDDELATEFITKKLDSLNERLIKGEIKHAHYRKSVKTLNNKMAKGNYDHRIVIPDTNAQLDALIEISYAWDMIVDKDTGEPIDALWGVAGCV